MFEIDKKTFGIFLAEQRRANGFTQRELAEKLYISDKAVSKWERGLSMPDISLLVPLAEILDVSVTELLEGKRMDQASEIKTEEVENIVKKALALSEDTPEKSMERRRKRLLAFSACALFTIIEMTAVMWFLAGAGMRNVFSDFRGMLITEGMLFGKMQEEEGFSHPEHRFRARISLHEGRKLPVKAERRHAARQKVVSP